MKAKAGLFALLIGMISLVGFGHTTDLGQNSNSVDCEFFETQTVASCVDFQMNEVAAITNENPLVYHYGFTVISTGFKTNLNGIENLKSSDLSLAIKPPEIHFYHNRNLSYIKYPNPEAMNEPKCHFCRNARDALRTLNS
ncbi:hypothetical protein BZARG_789 [Bizionia argentinensis JUB59]|uniref:Uncharacterized protein n=1 Tax=Bizionia argentinensis JUB59 TaxID=1046627 RepID=G2EBA6_9FLAO|nr:hypothetical protein [Bizionia argentinensis]EGV44259.1 hypothetical protein BZARG_789 [Bizionia argentinensis JUB59]